MAWRGWGGGGLLEIFISNIFFPPPSTEIKMGPSLISKKTGVANFKCTMWFPRQQSFYFWKPLWDSGSCPNNSFTKSLIKTLNLISHLIQGLISQCSFSLSCLNPAADNTFLHSLTTETKHISFPIKTTLFIKSQALSVNDCNMQLWWFCCHYQVLSLFPYAPQFMQLDGQLVLTHTSYIVRLS